MIRFRFPSVQYATPRLKCSVTRVHLSNFGSNSQITLPLSASSAKRRAKEEMTYITPSTTIGVVSKAERADEFLPSLQSPESKIHAGFKRLTFDLLISSSAENF